MHSHSFSWVSDVPSPESNMCLQNCKAMYNADLNDEHERVELQYWNVSDEFLGNCDYVDTENCKDIKIGINDLSVMQLNIRGLVGKQQDLNIYCQNVLKRVK